MVSLDVPQEVLHHDLSRVFVKEVIGRGDIELLPPEAARFLLLVVAQVGLEHVELDAAKDDEEE